ncbi:MAG: sigma-70 family RNA polymerase sigma factor [Phycisphaerae bacterium]|nr:sigma-70 family RNA polymerase sigma factor [Phycisphaerae bacterium]
MPLEMRAETPGAEPPTDWKEWHARVVAFARRFGDRALADDIAQEVCLRVLTYRRDEPVTTGFLIVTARNVAMRLLALRRREALVPSRGAGRLAGEAAPDRAEVVRRLASLPDRQREVVELTSARGLTERQAALALRMSRSAVCARRRSALLQLRRDERPRSQRE